MSLRISDIVRTPEDLGRAVRLARKRQKLRQDDLAAMAGLSHVFLGDLEKGKGSVSVGRMLKVLEELGLRLRIEGLDDSERS